MHAFKQQAASVNLSVVQQQQQQQQQVLSIENLLFQKL
jgi:hypothetical protein